ncbi:MAG: hypothetical protein IKQ25_12945 [Lachnospiraceae bacterium]|nr:hypothetical protein [Lachnospiraceae bacterium]
MTTVKKMLLLLLQLVILYCISAFISLFAPDVFLLRYSSTLFLMAVSVALLLYFADHVIDHATRKFLVGIGELITAWVVLRSAKYIAFTETEPIARTIWYLYYVPAMLIPLLSLFAALSVGREHWNLRPWLTRLSIGVTTLFILFFATNDLHQLAFHFHPGFEGWDSDYGRGPVFWLAYLWIFLLILGTFYILYHRCKLSSSRRLIWIPALPTVFGAVYLSLYAAGLWPRINGHYFGEFPETVCFVTAGIWLSLLCVGLIPSNAEYRKLFTLSSLGAQIADKDHQILYKSSNAAELSKEQMSAKGSIFLNPNTRLHRKAVSGGYVYWQGDETELNRINAELKEVAERLAEESELLRLENELKQKRAQIETQTKTYDELATCVLPQSQKIAMLSASTGQTAEEFHANMQMVCLLATYIKRYANLFLLAKDHKEMEAGELWLAISESLKAVRELGIPAEGSNSFQGSVPANSLLHAYTLFQALLEQSLPALQGLQVIMNAREIKLVLEGGQILLPTDCNATLSEEEGTTYVSIPFGKAGEPT